MNDRAAGAHAKARRRHVGRADARVQRRSGVLRRSCRRRRSPRGAARSTSSHDPCAERRARACDETVRATRARRHVAGRRVHRRAVDEGRVPARRADRCRRRPSCGATSSGRCSRREIEKRNPKSIAIDVSRVFAFNDGLSAGELEGMREALGPKWTSQASSTPTISRST